MLDDKKKTKEDFTRISLPFDDQYSRPQSRFFVIKNKRRLFDNRKKSGQVLKSFDKKLNYDMHRQSPVPKAKIKSEREKVNKERQISLEKKDKNIRIRSVTPVFISKEKNFVKNPYKKQKNTENH